MSIITLTTDYGLKDPFVGILKGKLYSEYPEATIVDITHLIDPFNIAETSYIIGANYRSFPKGTVHLIGVDAELNHENQHLAMLWNHQFFVCADNGILSMLTKTIQPEKIVAINIHERLSKEASDMDVFTTVACHLAKGGSLNVVGKEINELKTVTELQPQLSADGTTLKGHVIYLDHFGNVVLNITQKIFQEAAKGRNFEIQLRPKPIKRILNNYSEIALSSNKPLKEFEGSQLALFNEADNLEIALFRSNPNSTGSASSLFGLGYRDTITIKFK
jgi:S-adenosylmethionine hydrolase